ncbi:hypothetical protein [Mycobacterium europaeum]|uniref:hypothetical protein n=1 Tax=Mycobacterium europaeum TaxID=761804 RepID=UPI000B0353F0|nr:hypothetical protein [Mycobacterium europaeum]
MAVFSNESDNDFRPHRGRAGKSKDTGKPARHFGYRHFGVADAGNGPNFREIGS